MSCTVSVVYNVIRECCKNQSATGCQPPEGEDPERGGDWKKGGREGYRYSTEAHPFDIRHSAACTRECRMSNGWP